MALSKLASVELVLGELESSLQHFDQCIALNEQVGDIMSRSINIIDRARTLVAMGRFREGESDLQEVIDLSRCRDESIMETMAESILADLYLAEQRPDDAARSYRAAAAGFEHRIPREELSMRQALAEVRLVQKEPAAAYRHLSRAKALLLDFEDDGGPGVTETINSLERRIVGI